MSEFLEPTTYEDRVVAAQQLIAEHLASANGDIVVTNSFQAEDMVLLHMVRQTLPDVPVIFLDTGYHFAEVYAYRDRMAEAWSLKLTSLLPELGVAEQESQFGILNQTDPGRCCGLRKVKPLFSALEQYGLWFTGLRREQAKSRAALKEVDDFPLPSGRVIRKLSPLTEWSTKDVWTYAAEHNIPLLQLYDKGYTSIGCEPCTSLPLDPNDPRSGRWGGQKQECGIHLPGLLAVARLQEEQGTHGLRHRFSHRGGHRAHRGRCGRHHSAAAHSVSARPVGDRGQHGAGLLRRGQADRRACAGGAPAGELPRAWPDVAGRSAGRCPRLAAVQARRSAWPAPDADVRTRRHHPLHLGLAHLPALPSAGIARPVQDRSRLLGLIMFPIGAEVGFSSSGAGALGTVALLGMTNLTAPQVVGTDLAFGLAIALVGTGVHMIGGHYAADILIKMSIGGVLGGIAGSAVAPKIPNRALRLALSLWLTVIGFQFCWQAMHK